jgi:hypothetical protein
VNAPGGDDGESGPFDLDRVSIVPERRFDLLVGHFEAEPGVTTPGAPGRRGFGSSALKVNGSIFAMLTRGRLVVKLPRRRVAELIDQGVGDVFSAGKATPMKEWLTVRGDDDLRWRSLAAEALQFVGRAGGHGPIPHR